MLDNCPNCGAKLNERRCTQCGSIQPRAHTGNLKSPIKLPVPAEDVEAVFAMPKASTWPQSWRFGTSWWVCIALKRTRERHVLQRGLSENQAIQLASNLASQLKLG